MGEELHQHPEGGVQHEGAGVRDVLQDEEDEHTDDVVSPGGEVGDDVLQRVEGSPVSARGLGRGEGR